jgi:6-phosphogluconolactonase
MKQFLVVCLLIGGSAMADPVRFYLGTYTSKTSSQGIYTGTLETSTGQLSPLELVAKLEDPSFVAFSPDRKFFYAATEKGAGILAAYRLEADGRLTLLNELPGVGAGCHVSTDSTGRDVFVACYDAGNISAFQTKPDGSLDRRTAFFQSTGSGPNPDRQTKPHLHSMYADPENRHVYACDLGTDHVWIYDLDAATGVLTPANPPFAKVAPGSGPRHVAFSRDGRYVYVNGEMGLNVTVFERHPATGELTPVQTVPTVPLAAPTEGVTTAEIICHPTGKWLYVSNRGRGTIAVFAIGAAGKLTSLQDASVPVKVPRGFAIDPTGQWLVVGGQSDNKIGVMKIDIATGLLSATDQIAKVGAPVCVIFE